MISFRSDYSQGAHPKVLEALAATNLEHTDGYGLDPHCEHAAEMIRELVGRPDAAVHFLPGGTNCNVTFIASCLNPYESAICVRSGHAYFHETGAVEATGHRLVTVPPDDGKLTPEGIDEALAEHQDEHTPRPALVYISQPTEIGTVYSKDELAALSAKCRGNGLILYVDGARLGAALTCPEADLTLPELASLCDAFYIGGTKNGALFGEALVIVNDALKEDFRYMMKRQCSLVAKGRLLGVQFEALFAGGDGCVWLESARHANEMARQLREGLLALGVNFLGTSPTNQVFPILPAPVVRELEKDFFFYEWEAEREGKIPIRLVTGWGTQPGEIEAFLEAAQKALWYPFLGEEMEKL